MQSKRFDEFVSGFYVPEGGQSVVAASGEGTIQVSSKGVGCYRNPEDLLRIRIRINSYPTVFFSIDPRLSNKFFGVCGLNKHIFTDAALI
jgi:hypothetical protein